MKKEHEKDIIFVLIETQPGFMEGIVSELRSIDHIKEVNVVTGPFDLIVKIAHTNINDALDIVVHRIRTLEGIKNTETLITLKM